MALGLATVDMTFGLVGGKMTLASDPAFAASVGWTTSSRRTSTAMIEWRASITHCVVTCSATTYACGAKLSPSAWISSMLHRLAYPL